MAVEKQELHKIIEELLPLDKLKEMLGDEQFKKMEAALQAVKELEVKYKKLEASVKPLQEIEVQYNAIKEKERIENAFIASMTDSEFVKRAEKIIREIQTKVSVGYTVDLTFTPHPYEKLRKLATKKIEIRTTSKQHRHITPVAVMEHIFNNAIQEGDSIDQLLLRLKSKVEIFKSSLTEKDNTYIQAVFDFFKKPEYQTPSGVNLLIKLLAHFYNTKVSLNMRDTYVKIPYKIQNCYITPLLGFSGNLNIHQEEGSFVNLLCTNLDRLNGLCQQKKALTSVQKKQMLYMIFALFDYLPLPKNAKNPEKSKLNSKKDRYIEEPIERLYQVAATHLHFIFEAYPRLFDQFKKEIFARFLHYVSVGVRKEDLFALFKAESFSSLCGELIASQGQFSNFAIASQFTNAGDACGFARQYGYKDANAFFNLLAKNVQKQLIAYNAEYFLDLNPHLVRSPKDSSQSLLNQQNISDCFEDNAIEFLCSKFNKDGNFEDSVPVQEPKKIEDLLKINMKLFKKVFRGQMLNALCNKKSQLVEESMGKKDPSNKLLLRYLTKEGEKAYATNVKSFYALLQKLKGYKHSPTLIRQSIKIAYEESKENLALTKEASAELQEVVFIMRKPANTTVMPLTLTATMQRPLVQISNAVQLLDTLPALPTTPESSDGGEYEYTESPIKEKITRSERFALKEELPTSPYKKPSEKKSTLIPSTPLRPISQNIFGSVLSQGTTQGTKRAQTKPNDENGSTKKRKIETNTTKSTTTNPQSRMWG